MKELRKLAIILRALGLYATVENNDFEIFVFCKNENRSFEIWYYDTESDFMPGYYEIHLYAGRELINDQIYNKSLKNVVKIILN